MAANLSRRTGHAREDLEQIAMVGIILAARRYVPERGNFRPFARRYANGEVHHFLRDRGFLIKVPPSWRESCTPGGESSRGLVSPVRRWRSGWG